MFFVNLDIFLKAILKAFSIANNSASNTFIFNPRFHERLSELSILKLIVQNIPAPKLFVFSFLEPSEYTIMLLTF
jgi:hypothetical protein